MREIVRNGDVERLGDGEARQRSDSLRQALGRMSKARSSRERGAALAQTAPLADEPEAPGHSIFGFGSRARSAAEDFDRDQ